MSDVHEEVQAALLNSGDDPEDEIAEALHAVAQFAVTECGADAAGLHNLLDLVIQRLQREGEL